MIRNQVLAAVLISVCWISPTIASLPTIITQTANAVKANPGKAIALVMALAHLNRLDAKHAHVIADIPTGPVDFTDRHPESLILRPFVFIDGLIAKTTGYCFGSALKKIDQSTGYYLSALLRFDDNTIIGQKEKVVGHKQETDVQGSTISKNIIAPATGILGQLDKHLSQLVNIATLLSVGPQAAQTIHGILS